MVQGTNCKYAFMYKAVAAAVGREGALPQQLRLRQQQRTTTGPKYRGVVVAEVNFLLRLVLFHGLFLDPGPGPSPFRVNSAFPAFLYCSLSSPGKRVDPEERCSLHLRRGTRPLHRSRQLPLVP